MQPHQHSCQVFSFVRRRGRPRLFLWQCYLLGDNTATGLSLARPVWVISRSLGQCWHYPISPRVGFSHDITIGWFISPWHLLEAFITAMRILPSLFCCVFFSWNINQCFHFISYLISRTTRWESKSDKPVSSLVKKTETKKGLMKHLKASSQ